ncbi:MAG: hypothetical protein DCC65_17685 [Planctomycetota bacterium]|nr:MAG: hypothetical protein DCC65_17685 [Planctomycetota bacterium]
MALILLFLMIGLLIVIDRGARNQVQRQVAAIRARGEPVSVDDLNAARPNIPREQNSFFLVEQQAAIIKSLEIPDEVMQHLPVVGGGWRFTPTGERMSAECETAVRWYVDAISAPLAAIHDAARGTGYATIDWTTPAIDACLPPGISDLPKVGRSLALEARLAAHEARSEDAVRIIEDGLRIGRYLEFQPTLISAIVKLGVEAGFEHETERTINICGLPDSCLRSLQAAFKASEGRPDLRSCMLIERVLTIDFHLHALPAGQATTHLPAPGPLVPIWKYIPLAPKADARAGIEMANRLCEAVDPADFGAVKRVEAIEQFKVSLPWYCYTARYGAGGNTHSRWIKFWIRHLGMNRTIQAAIAAERYRLAHGQWPGSLDVLVPDYIDAVPIDPFDDRPIRYAIVPEGIKTWVIGDDLSDEGGNIKHLEESKTEDPVTDWGWIILNPELRGRPVGAALVPATQAATRLDAANN